MRAVALCLPTLLLAACNGSDQPARSKTRTVLAFLEDPRGFEETWMRCRNDPGGIGQSADCRNAGAAKERLMMLGRERAIRSLKTE
jgi:hypothetical protein